MSPLDLGAAVVKKLVQRSGIDPRTVSSLIFGAVAPSLTHPNIAREIVFNANLPREIEAHSVVRACVRDLAAGDREWCGVNSRGHF